MLKRLIVGLLIGVVVGAGAAAAIIKGLGMVLFAATSLGTLTAYLAALATGAFVALVAGKPVWAKGAWIEVGLKAFFGSLLAAGAMFALRRWGVTTVNLSSFGASPVEGGAIGYLPAAALPIIATVLSMFFEIDNTDAPEEQAPAKTLPGTAKAQVRVAGSASKPAIAASKDEADGEEEPVVSKKQRS
jgi:hypothetical protein